MTTQLVRARTRSLGVPVAIVLGIPYALGILLLTLSPQPVQRRMPALLDFVLRFINDTLGWRWLGFNKLELIANVLVFLPIGILAYIALRDRRILLALAIGPALSIAVEIAQAALLPHRVGTVVDVFANTTGACIGVGLAWLVARAIPGEAALPSNLERP